MLELVDKDIKTGITVFHMFKKLRHKEDPNQVSRDNYNL